MEEIIASQTEKDLLSALTGGNGKYERFILAALSSIPWFGLASAVSSLKGEFEQEESNKLLVRWISEHRQKAEELAVTLKEILARLESVGAQIDARIQSEDYLSLVKTVFRSWDDADTFEKRQMYKKLITNAAIASRELSPDDLIRLFINWLNQYHEAHFRVIKAIFQNPGITRFDIWDSLNGSTEMPREDSLEADLFKYLIGELNLGRVIRQARETDGQGRFLRRTVHRSRTPSSTMESAFEDTKPYVLTELGKQFVHFVMEDVVRQIGTSQSSDATTTNHVGNETD